MSWNGLTSYDKAGKLLEFFKSKNLTEISELELAKYIGMFIGCSKYFKTVKNYIGYMIGFNMLILKAKDIYTINYEILKEIEESRAFK